MRDHRARAPLVLSVLRRRARAWKSISRGQSAGARLVRAPACQRSSRRIRSRGRVVASIRRRTSAAVEYFGKGRSKRSGMVVPAGSGPVGMPVAAFWLRVWSFARTLFTARARVRAKMPLPPSWSRRCEGSRALGRPMERGIGLRLTRRRLTITWTAAGQGTGWEGGQKAAMCPVRGRPNRQGARAMSWRYVPRRARIGQLG